MLSRATSIPAYTSSRIRRSGRGGRAQGADDLGSSHGPHPSEVLDRSNKQCATVASRVDRSPPRDAGSDDERALGRRDRVRQRGRAGEVLRPPRPPRPGPRRSPRRSATGRGRRRRRRTRPATEVLYAASRAMLPRSSRSTPSCSTRPGLLRAGEAHREQHQLGRDLALGALDLGEPAVLEHHLDQAQRPHVAVLVAEELLRRDGVDAASPASSCAEETRKIIGYVGHGWPGGPRLGRLRHDLQLGDRGRALAGGGAEAVRAGVAAADDHDVLARRR